MDLKDLNLVPYHPVNEQLLDVLRTKTQNLESDLYFRVLGAYFMTQMASSMHINVSTPHRGDLPINMFACGLMESGGGKGHSMNIMEREIVNSFKKNFMTYTYPDVSTTNIETEAAHKALANASDYEEELDKLSKEFNSYGPMPFSFDSGTGPAFKQIRTKAQIAKIGSLNMVCDEIGTNLLNNSELFAVNLEAYDIGLIKQKITKQSSENKRAEERDDPVPSNMLIFGTPSKLFNGAKEEQEFYSLLETGYARRLFFAIGSKTMAHRPTAEQLFDMLTDKAIDTTVGDLSVKFAQLADAVNYNKKLVVEKDVALINLEYQLQCEERAAALPQFEQIKKAEMQHRYFKALKLAGTYAFIDGTWNITEHHMYAAIKLTEDSGKAFESILSRDRAYARLAKYIVECGKELTLPDLVEDLPFFGGSNAKMQEMLTLATAYGYKNNIIIKRSFLDNIEFIKGESLKQTDLNQMIVSYSKHEAFQYLNKTVPFDKLHILTNKPDMHWVNHHVMGGDSKEMNGHRCDEKVLSGFNMIVIDVDGECSLETAKLVLKDYKALYHTTKRHTPEINRFRIILPLSFELKLNGQDFKEFMNNIYNDLPFNSDTSTGQRSRKWMTHKGHYEYTEGDLFDPLPFIPKTAKSMEREKANKNLGSMDKVERWFAKIWSEGDRNNTLIKYALMLLDGGMEPSDVNDHVIAFNGKMSDPLPKTEIEQTVLRSVYSKAA